MWSTKAIEMTEEQQQFLEKLKELVMQYENTCGWTIGVEVNINPLSDGICVAWNGERFENL